MSAIVETGKLLEAAGASLAGAIVVTLAFSLAIRGAARSAELRRLGRSVTAGAYAGLAVLGGAAFLGALAVGLLIMTSK